MCRSRASGANHTKTPLSLESGTGAKTQCVLPYGAICTFWKKK